MKNSTITAILKTPSSERQVYNWLTLFAWQLENCKRNEERSIELELLFNKWNENAIDEIADFDVKLIEECIN